MSQSEDILRATSDVLLEMGRNTLAKVLRQLAEVGSCTISLGPKDLGYFEIVDSINRPAVPNGWC